MNEKVTEISCKVCQGWIIERSRQIYVAGNYDDPVKEITGHHCENCGIEYHKLPK